MGRAQRSEKRKQPFLLQSFFQFSRNLQRSRSIVSPDLDVDRVAWSLAGLLPNRLHHSEHVMWTATRHERTSVWNAAQGRLYGHLSPGGKLCFGIVWKEHIRPSAIASFDLRLEFIRLHGCPDRPLNVLNRVDGIKSSLRPWQKLLFRAGPFRRRLRPAQAGRIIRNTLIETLRDTLAILWLLELSRVLLIGYKRDLRQDRRHVRPDQHDKWRLLDPAILQSGIALLQPAIETRLHIAGKLARLIDLVLQSDFLHQVAQLMDRLVADRVLTCGRLESIRRRRKVQIVRLYSTRAGVS